MARRRSRSSSEARRQARRSCFAASAAKPELRASSHRARRLIAAGTIALALAFLALLTWDLLSIKRDLDAGRDDLEGLTFQSASTAGLTEFASAAAGHLEQADDRAHDSLALRALSILPAVDDQVEGMRRLTGAAAALGRTGAESARRLDEELEKVSRPGGRLALVDAALEELEEVAATLGDVDLGPPTGLLPPLRDAHEDLTDALTEAETRLVDGRKVLRPLREMLAGPTSLALLAANNAEMAGGAGLALSAGVLTIEDGEIELSDVIPARVLRLPDSIDIPDRIREIYQPTGVGIDLRSTTRSPDLATMGPIAADLLEVHGVDVDGAILVDAVALRDLMAVTGGVTVAGRKITVDDVLEQVLHANYVSFEDDGRADRDAYQGDIARAVFDALTEREVPAAELADALLTSSKGRHLMLWSESPPLQDAFEDLEVAGALDPHGLLISFQNYAANKLDWYLRPTADMHVEVLPSGDFRATLSMSMEVPAIEDLSDASPYILGPTPAMQGLFLTVHLPEAAYDIATPDPRGFRTEGEEPPMQVRTFLTDVPMGTTYEQTIEFSIPRKIRFLQLLPSARIEPLELTIDDRWRIDDVVPQPFSWAAAFPEAPHDEPAPLAVRVPALLGLLATVVAAGTLALHERRRSQAAASAGPTSATTPVAAAAALLLFAIAAGVAIVLALQSTNV